MNEINFQSVFDKLQEVLPSSWDEVVFYAGYTTGSYSMKYYVKTDNQIISCFEQTDVDRLQLIRLFMAIDEELTPARKSNPSAKSWSVMTMIVDADGNMKTHFDYTDISENSIAYAREWEQKYL